jgi:Fic family protein
MAEYLVKQWDRHLEREGLSRRDRRAGRYSAYLPDRLVGREIILTGDTAADVAEAEAAITRLDTSAVTLVDTEALARLLLRAEAVASSRIEGLEIGARRLLRAEAVRAVDGALSDAAAIEVLGNIDAMAAGIAAVSEGTEISPELICAVHRTLVARTRLAQYGGQFRDRQNWMGGSSYHPCTADFVPPPPEYVGELMEDLAEFCNGDDLPAVAQAAIAHAQFEAVHPFVDGNGRTGRALIHLILRRRGLACRVVPPISLVLATWTSDYIDGLTKFRYLGRPDTPEAIDGLNIWLGRFAAACTRSVTDAAAFEARAAELSELWRSRLGGVRAGSATDLLLRRLPGIPVLTVNAAAAMIDRGFPAVNAAIARLVEADVLRQVTVGRRNRVFESPEVISAFTDLERRLASPVGDTRVASPQRPVPRR